jgi:hypothetical protein
MKWAGEFRSKFESVVSALLVTTIFIGVLIYGSTLINALDKGSLTNIASWIGVLLGLVLDGWLFFATWYGVLENRHPLAPFVALIQPRLPWVLGIPVAIWWAIHVVLGIWWMIVMVRGIPAGAWVVHLFAAPIIWGQAYLIYNFVLLIVALFDRRPVTIARVWKWAPTWALVVSLAVGSYAVVRELAARVW